MPAKKSMKAVFDCSADEPGELSFKEGDILVDVEESGEEGWYTGRIQHTSETGLFPYNYVVELLPAQKQEEPPLSKFPPLDAFEAAISPNNAGKAFSKSNNNWTSTATATTISQPPIIAAKPKLASTAPSSSSNSNVGLGIRVYGSNNNISSSSTFEKPQLKPIGSIKSMESSTSPTRSRSYSTSAVSNTPEKEPMNAEKTLRPSQLLNGKGTKSALELALSKGSPKSPSSSSSGVKSNAFSTSVGNSTGGIALPGLSTIKLNSTPHDVVEEEEDGFQMVKPSQLRSRQQVTPIRPIVSQSSSFASTTSTSTTAPSWKKTTDTTVFTNVKTASPSSLSSTSSSPRPTSGSKLDAAPSTSTPMPRLPSRPVSTASRRSRNSRNSSSSLKSSPSTSNKTTPTASNANLPPVRETNEKTNSAPPALKPKPQIAATAQPNLPPRPKLRSTSNPPPIQPKPAMSSIEILLSKNKNELAVSATPSKSTTPPPRNAATKPVLSSTNKKPFNLSSKPSLDSWQSLDNAKESSHDVNIKPSALLKNNRVRSATNPVSYSTMPEWMSAVNKQPKPSTATKPAPVPYERPTSPIAHPVSRSPAPVAAAVIEPAAATTKKNPPPPPPSRPPKSQNSNSKQRYEVLFDTIHDDGYVDGETAHFVWLKSKLSNEDLARIWRECDPDHKGLLDKHAFIDGMSKIDELLSLKQQQQAV
ncbi:uncharacterized protein ATC70_009798 [Mucor velutinosus]|uniref:SH3 domain-containing protein n=1 Tax=Mucor velutinosus TaxID=708070 RepID=A0AAN7I3K0_9FUNG|nr:hypothetical protein ATC70_009798 [Mucor velutinosus]